MSLLGTLDLGRRSLQTQRQAIEVTGNNLANVNTAGYSRQRLVIQSASTIDTDIGPQGTGAEAVRIEQLRSTLLDRQAESELSVQGSLEAQQRTLQLLQAKVGQQIDRQAAGATSATQGVSGQNGLADDLSGLFNTFQSLSAQPTSLDARQTVLNQAQKVVDGFHTVATGVAALEDSLNQSIGTDVTSANALLKDVATLNDQIARAESGSGAQANELRDARQQKLEALAKIAKVDVAEDSTGMVDVSLSGASLVSGNQMTDTLEAYDTGTGDLGVRTKTGATPLTINGGSLNGYIQVRDGSLVPLKQEIDQLAKSLVDAVNTAHGKGFGLTGATGNDFFTGTDAATLGLNAAVVGNPALIQASGDAAAKGDNAVALALAQLGNQPQAALNGATFNEKFTRSVTEIGDALANVNSDLTTQKSFQDLLETQRNAVSGVSLDEEMTNMMKFQKAYEASARLINTVDSMLDTVIGLK